MFDPDYPDVGGVTFSHNQGGWISPAGTLALFDGARSFPDRVKAVVRAAHELRDYLEKAPV